MILVNCPEMTLHIDLASNSSFFLQYCHSSQHEIFEGFKFAKIFALYDILLYM